MKNKDYHIVVTGDICVNILQWITQSQQETSYNYRLYPNVHYNITPGGALLLAQLIELSTDARVHSPRLPNLKTGVRDEYLRATIAMDTFPVSLEDRNNQHYRVKQFYGYSDPSNMRSKLLPVYEDEKKADMVVLYDEDNGFNSEYTYWPSSILSSKEKPVIIYKMNHPTKQSMLWKNLIQNHADRTIVVIAGNDLRTKGINLSRGLSWEQTALDFLWQMKHNPDLAFLSQCQHLIVPFGLEGAIYYSNIGEVNSRLFFLTYSLEDDFSNDQLGVMYGLTSCFVAGLAKSFMGREHPKDYKEAITEGIREGIVASQKYYRAGFGKNIEKDCFPNPSIFVEEKNSFIFKEHVQDVLIRNTHNSSCQACWYMLKNKSSTNLAEIAYNIVKYGEQDALKFIPIVQFGNLKLVDRTEIEGYRTIRNLIKEYVVTPEITRPLCIAVFGTPGLSKSFGVTEVASTIDCKLIEKVEFDLSQFQSVIDLYHAFHRIRDVSFMGKLPLVFFDEFDSNFEGRLGWLKYFLAPMQDGVLKEDDNVPPIGKAIFVFTGGTSSTFRQFSGGEMEGLLEQKQFKQEFAMAKGPDFMSRLRGYVNLLGPNQTEEHWDQLYMIRRAIFLRLLLECRAPHLINQKFEAQVDNGVIRAMLRVPRYKHESKSMEAIFEMSCLNSVQKWEQAHLPSKDQLSLHVEEELFLHHLTHDGFYSERIDRIAQEIYDVYVMHCKDEKQLQVSQNFEGLSKEEKNLWNDQARHLPNALQKIKYDIVSVNELPETVKLTKDELPILAAYEHKRWSLYKKEAGWTYGLKFDMKAKTHPSLVSWEALLETSQQEIIERVKAWPEILSRFNFKLERTKFLCYCESQLKNHDSFEQS